ncbi:hypothetical protein C9374_004164 [Naegleria lovaniensis]|uniref:Uncharacterized protein n=1 Tax=Naegleria lovaniensis TaxID=51637 RepID=A0AA88KKV5_NAELO|nr:uncharacterized protein C9374_004164 [Naegleria lovaniensis]KAG2383493.1 hypothetical protein C9374_004164 [Naegleria lovaniensis]
MRTSSEQDFHVLLSLVDLKAHPTPSSSKTDAATIDQPSPLTRYYVEDEVDDSQYLMKLLQQRMRNHNRRNNPFSMNPKDVFVFSPNLIKDISKIIHMKESYAPDLFDVKISYNSKCILLSDFNNSCIEVFDLETKQYKFRISPLPNRYTRFMCIEENYDGQNNDALLLCCSTSVFKYDLKQFLSKQDDSPLCDPIWINEDCLWAQGIVISYSRKQVFICDADSNKDEIVVLKLQTGQLIQKFKAEKPFGIAFSPMEDHLIVSSAGSKTPLTIFQESGKTNDISDWTIFKTIAETAERELTYNFVPLTVDRNAERSSCATVTKSFSKYSLWIL